MIINDKQLEIGDWEIKQNKKKEKEKEQFKEE